MAVARDFSAGSKGAAGRPTESKEAGFEELKQRIHSKLVDKLDLSRIGDLQGNVLRREIRLVVEHLCDTEDTLLNRNERDRLIDEVLDETFGLGPLEVLLKDPTISDILINGPKHVYCERRGKMEKSTVTFRDNGHLMQIIDRIISKVGRRVDETCPMVDARMQDGSRFNAIIPPLALDGACVSIRRFGANPLKLEDLLNYKAFTPEMVMLLEGAIKARLNIIISGGTGSGKTTLLNTLSSFIPNSDRIVTIEDAAELQLQQDHVVRLETRPPNIEGKGAITATDLVRNALRMRPERIIIGECRGPETLDMLQAMNTGHEGSMTTLHANTPRDAIARLETMIMMAGFELPLEGDAHADRQRRGSDRPGQPAAKADRGRSRTSRRSSAWSRTRSSCRTCTSSSSRASMKMAGRTANSLPRESGPHSCLGWKSNGIRATRQRVPAAGDAGGLAMLPGPIVLIAVAVFVGVAATVGGVLLMFSEPKRPRAEETPRGSRPGTLAAAFKEAF